MDNFVIKRPRLATGDPNTSPESSVVPSVSCSENAAPLLKKPITGKGRAFQLSWKESFPWLEWNGNIKKAFCTSCKDAHIRGLLSSNSKKEVAFVSSGFSNWKNALEKFRAHEKTSVHKDSIMKLSSLSEPSVVIQLTDQTTSEMLKSREALRIILSTVRFLSRQGLAIRGHDDFNSNFRQLLEVRRNDVSLLDEWMKRKGYQWFSPAVQNEMIQLMANSVVRLLSDNIKKSNYFAILVDETSDISTQEQVSFCVRTVGDDFEVKEDFLGLYETPNTKSSTLLTIVKDILLRLDLPFEHLRGQCYDGASNMRGEINGLQKQILDLQPQAIYVHCAAHNLNLAVQDSLRHLPAMRDTMNLGKDLINTVRDSPKRMNCFQSIVIEGKPASQNLRPLCPTRWTMRASSMERILENYDRLLLFFEDFSVADSSDASSKCAGYLESMSKFKFYFMIKLYCEVMSPVEEVSSKIQCPSLVASDIKKMIQCLKEVVSSKRSSFVKFWDNCMKTKPAAVDNPCLPRQRKLGSRADATYSFESPQEYFRIIFFETVDTVFSCITERFNLEGLELLSNVESEMLKIANEECDLGTIPQTEAFFKNDINSKKLVLHLQMIGDICRERGVPLNSVRTVQRFLNDDETVKQLFPELCKAIKLLFTVPVTTATAERSFSELRRLKTYLRSTMRQKRLNHLAILNAHQKIVDDLDLELVANEFILSNPIRKSTFALYKKE